MLFRNAKAVMDFDTFVRWRTDGTPKSADNGRKSSDWSSDMAKGQQRGNRETKKPKKAKAPPAVPASSNRTVDKGARFIPVRPK